MCIIHHEHRAAWRVAVRLPECMHRLDRLSLGNPSSSYQTAELHVGSGAVCQRRLKAAARFPVTGLRRSLFLCPCLLVWIRAELSEADASQVRTYIKHARVTVLNTRRRRPLLLPTALFCQQQSAIMPYFESTRSFALGTQEVAYLSRRLVDLSSPVWAI